MHRVLTRGPEVMKMFFKNSGPDKPWNAIHYWPFGASEFWDAHVPIGPFLLRNKPSLQISFLWSNHSILVFVTFWRMTVEMFLSDFSKYREWRFKIFFNDWHPVCCGTIFCYSAVNCLHLHFIAFDVRVAKWDRVANSPGLTWTSLRVSAWNLRAPGLMLKSPAKRTRCCKNKFPIFSFHCR